MATKQTSLRANKQAKRQKRAKQKQVHARKEEAFSKKIIGRREMAKLYSEQATDESIADQANRRLKQLKKKVRQGKMTKAQFDEATSMEDKLTNVIVMQNINDVIPAIIRVHSGVEVFCRLADEKRFEITPEEQALINRCDEQITKVTEDINAIVAFVDGKKEPEDYMDIFMHYTEMLARLFDGTIPDIMLMLTPRKPEIDGYADEHHNKETTPIFEYMRTLHCERMEKVFPLYHTQVSAEGDAADVLHSYTPENPMPSDPVIDADVADAVLLEAPDVEKDVVGDDTEHLLSTDANAERLRESIAQLQAGDVIEQPVA
jgi:hypothetical protein